MQRNEVKTKFCTCCVDAAETSLLCRRWNRMDTPTTVRSAYRISTVKPVERRELGRYGCLLLNCSLINTVSPNTFYTSILEVPSLNLGGGIGSSGKLSWFLPVPQANFEVQPRWRRDHFLQNPLHVIVHLVSLLHTLRYWQNREIRHTKETECECVDWI
jgi:hypothetical protein